MQHGRRKTCFIFLKVARRKTHVQLHVFAWWGSVLLCLNRLADSSLQAADTDLLRGALCAHGSGVCSFEATHGARAGTM